MSSQCDAVDVVTGTTDTEDKQPFTHLYLRQFRETNKPTDWTLDWGK